MRTAQQINHHGSWLRTPTGLSHPQKNTVTNHTPLLYAAHFSHQRGKKFDTLIKDSEETEWRGKHSRVLYNKQPKKVANVMYYSDIPKVHFSTAGTRKVILCPRFK